MLLSIHQIPIKISVYWGLKIEQIYIRWISYPVICFKTSLFSSDRFTFATFLYKISEHFYVYVGSQTDEKLKFDENMYTLTRYDFRMSKYIILMRKKHNNNFIIIFSHPARSNRILLGSLASC